MHGGAMVGYNFQFDTMVEAPSKSACIVALVKRDRSARYP